MFATKNKELISDSLKQLKKNSLNEKIKITHVCGTHEMTASKFGIRSQIPQSIELISGPGCPVCVCPSFEIDFAIELAKQGKIITTFGDMLKVPASNQSLAEVKRDGCDIRIVYSPIDAIKIAEKTPKKEIVFLAIGFETTAPMTADALLSFPIENFSVLSAHRLTIPAMELLLKAEHRKTKGFICPGHVSTITGIEPYMPFSNKYKMPCVIAGFEAIDMIISIIQIVKMIENNTPAVINEYSRVVKSEGNLIAKRKLEEVFNIVDANWRGIGNVEKSGLAISSEFESYNAFKRFDITIEKSADIQLGCKCPEVMLGNISPSECQLFMKKCKPDHPVGPCMVSHEGTCAISARYGSTYIHSP